MRRHAAYALLRCKARQSPLKPEKPKGAWTKIDVMALQNDKAYTEWERLREKIAVTDRAERQLAELREQRRGKKAIARAAAVAAKARQAEEAQKEVYERTKGEILRAAEAKQAEKMPG